MSEPINAYPLSWPNGWPRTLAHSRTRAKFVTRSSSSLYGNKQSLSVTDGLNRVLTELGRLGVDRQDMIVSTNVRTRLDGLPRSGEREPDDPGVAVYWQDQRGSKKVMAIDQYDRVADNLGAIAATLDALRAIERHGGGQILERAFTGFTALPSPDHKKTWRQVLGVDGSGWTEIESAYRRLRSQHHPDKGGDASAFNEIQRAYDEARRELRP